MDRSTYSCVQSSGCICGTCSSPVKDCCYQHPELICTFNPTCEEKGQHCKGYSPRKEGNQDGT